MNIHATRPDRSPEAVARRKNSTDQARAMNMRQGYVWDEEFEQLTAAYVAGDITKEEYRVRGIAAPGTN